VSNLENQRKRSSPEISLTITFRYALFFKPFREIMVGKMVFRVPVSVLVHNENVGLGNANLSSDGLVRLGKNSKQKLLRRAVKLSDYGI